MLQIKRSKLFGLSLLLLIFGLNPIGLLAQDQDEKDKTRASGLEHSLEIEKYGKCDMDVDGKINKEEFKLYLEIYLDWFTKSDEAFDAMDKDKDGQLTFKEFGYRRAAIRKIDSADKALKRREGAKPKEWKDTFNERFLPAKPVIGDTISGDLTAFNDKGEKIQFKDFHGKHTVVIFGCLT